jgi:hypothetical protein
MGDVEDVEVARHLSKGGGLVAIRSTAAGAGSSLDL